MTIGHPSSVENGAFLFKLKSPLNKIIYLGQDDIIAFGDLNINFRAIDWDVIDLNKNNTSLSDFNNLSQISSNQVSEVSILGISISFHC